jgi:hypothetical protein
VAAFLCAFGDITRRRVWQEIILRYVELKSIQISESIFLKESDEYKCVLVVRKDLNGTIFPFI